MSSFLLVVIPPCRRHNEFPPQEKQTEKMDTTTSTIFEMSPMAAHTPPHRSDNESSRDTVRPKEKIQTKVRQEADC